jgi:integrase
LDTFTDTFRYTDRMENKMSKTQGLLERDNGYYFQARIPKKYLAHFPNTIVRDKLPTNSREEAKALVRKHWAALHEEYERIDATGSRVKKIPIGDEADHLIALSLHSRLFADDEIRSEGVSDDDVFDMLSDSHIESEEAERLAIARGILTPLATDIVTDWLQGYGYEFDANTPEYKVFALKFMKAQSVTTKKLKQRQLGEHVETPIAPVRLISRPESRFTLNNVYDKWLLERKPSRSTQDEWKLCIRIFEELNGNLTIDLITKAHVVKFKDKRVEDGKAYATVKKQVGGLSSLLQYAVDNDYIPKNPATGVKIAKPKVEEEPRLPYSIDNLNTIFLSSIYTKGYRPRAKGLQGEALYWIPLIALFTGARMTEIGQLQRGDVKQEGGYHYFDISNNAEEAKIKTDSSRRKVPIHKELINLGFLDYVKLQSESLFPLLVSSNQGRLMADFSRWWGRKEQGRKIIGISNPQLTFHSFRHSFKDACRNSGIPQDAHDKLTGHSSAGVGASYGLGYSIKSLGEHMSKLTYEGLDLSHLNYVNSK